MKKCGGKDPLTAAPGFPVRAAGFSLVELLIAAAIGLVVLGAMYSVFTIQNKTFGNQEQIVELQQNVRAAMDMMGREIRMAGYDPAGVNTDTNPANNFSGVTVNASQLQVRADQNSDGAIDATSEENIIYVFDSGNKRITRNIGAGAQSLAENIDSFTFEYLKGDDSVATVPADVRQIRITITGRTAKIDPTYSTNGGYRQYTLTSIIALRN